MIWDVRAYRYADTISCDYTQLTQEAVDAVHSIGRKVTAWVVDNKQDMKKMQELGVDAVITNHPDEFSDVINGLV